MLRMFGGTKYPVVDSRGSICYGSLNPTDGYHYYSRSLLDKHGNYSFSRKGFLLSALAILLLAVFVMGPVKAVAQEADGKLTVTDLAPVAVSGALPGPSLWKVNKGSHVMWVLGVTKPLPRKMQWETSTIDRVVGASQSVLKAPGLEAWCLLSK